MIVRLIGTLVDLTEESAIIEQGGIAREVLVPRFALGELAACRGKEVAMHTLEFFEGNPSSGHLVPRMLGFLHREDRLFFTRFQTVKGIGPKKSLKALTEPTRRVATWIESGDTKALSQLPGIGKRVAELIVATLKGKLSDLALPESAPGKPVSQLTQNQRDALELLVAWGDSRVDAERWVERVAQIHPDLSDPEDWVRAAYRIKTGVEG